MEQLRHANILLVGTNDSNINIEYSEKSAMFCYKINDCSLKARSYAPPISTTPALVASEFYSLIPIFADYHH